MAITLEPVVELRPIEGLHIYVFAPLTVSMAESSLQIVTDGLTERTGIGNTVTVTCDEAVQPLLFDAVTVYVVVEDGLAITLGPADVFNDEDGLHAYEFPPFAVSVAGCPLQTDVEGLTDSAGEGFTVTVTCAVAEQPREFPVTVYVVVETGFAVTLEPVDELNDEEGLHVKLPAPLAVSKIFCPLQIESSGETARTG